MVCDQPFLNYFCY